MSWGQRWDIRSIGYLVSILSTPSLPVFAAHLTGMPSVTEDYVWFITGYVHSMFRIIMYEIH